MLRSFTTMRNLRTTSHRLFSVVTSDILPETETDSNTENISVADMSATMEHGGTAPAAPVPVLSPASPAATVPAAPSSQRRAMALPAVSPRVAVERVRSSATAKFDETIELSLGLGLDPRKPNQSLRTLAQLPHGSGKKAIVAVFAQGEAAERAKAAGAEIVGAEDLLKEIQEGTIRFSRCIATPDMMPLVGRVARILGPKGLMPNPKMGTVTLDVESAVSNAMKGEIELRADKYGFVNLPLGKVSFSSSKLLDNLRAVMVTVTNEKPTGSTGKYLKQAVICSTMGGGFQVDCELLDPSNQKFMKED